MWSQEALAYNCIDTGDDAGLEAAFNNLITTFANQITLPKEIFQLGQRYTGVKKSDKAEQFYQYVIDKWPNNEYALQSACFCIVRKFAERKFLNQSCG
jgi:TolA-binding protein